MKLFLTFCLILSTQFVRAQAVSPSARATATVAKSANAAEKAVIDAEKQRFDAQVNKDYAVLDRVLADDMIYTHSHGGSDTKQSFVQSIRDGKSKYDGIDVEEQKVRVYGNSAVVNGVILIKSEPANTRLRYTDVYIKKNGQWQMVAWQSLKVQ